MKKQAAITPNGNLDRLPPIRIPLKKVARPARPKLTASEVNRPSWMISEKEKAATAAAAKEAAATEEKDKFASTAPVYTMDKKLVDFLKTYKIETEEAQYAHAYLSAGPPFKGIHDKLFKLSIKELGLKWLKNPEFVHKINQRFGWYVAHNVRELREALRMPRKVDGDRAWAPSDLDEASSRQVGELLEEYTESRRVAEEKAQRDDEERRKLKAVALGRGNGGIHADAPRDIEAIRSYMLAAGYTNWAYDRDLIATSSSCAALGPTTATNALRVHRGLRHDIITPMQVALGQWLSDEELAKRKREEAIAIEQTRKAEAVALEDREEAQLKKLKTKASRAVAVLKRDDELETGLEDDGGDVAAPDAFVLPRDYVYDLCNRSLKPTTCFLCKTKIHEQFMDCECVSVFWTKCPVCDTGYHKTQVCPCETRV